jgi:hypothetical protein
VSGGTHNWVAKLSDDALFVRYSACNKLIDAGHDELFPTWLALDEEIARRGTVRDG